MIGAVCTMLSLILGSCLSIYSAGQVMEGGFGGGAVKGRLGIIAMIFAAGTRLLESLLRSRKNSSGGVEVGASFAKTTLKTHLLYPHSAHIHKFSPLAQISFPILSVHKSEAEAAVLD